MSVSILEYIARNIEADINLITTGAGFNQTLVAHRPRRIDFLDQAWNDLDAIIKQGDSVKLSDEGLMIDRRQTFEITVIVIDVDSETDSIDTRLNAVQADVEKKLYADLTRGGYAYSTSVEGSTMLNPNDGGPGGITITITVDYRTNTGDPFTQ